MNGIKTIIWDWNGTLLDDAEICRSIINELLAARDLDELSLKKYKEIFTFPVKDYYQKAGFDFTKEAFEIPADEFMVSYHERIKIANLHQNAIEILAYAKNKYQQVIVSAMEHQSLNALIKKHNIHNYFHAISGINNHYAHSKTANAKQLISANGLTASEACLIGDTIHDYEVAESIGCECILIAKGHQSYERLASTGKIVLNSLIELKSYL